jgi:hypothetical protein
MSPKIGESRSLGGETPAATERNRRGITSSEGMIRVVGVGVIDSVECLGNLPRRDAEGERRGWPMIQRVDGDTRYEGVMCFEYETRI